MHQPANSDQSHWAALEERGAYAGLWVLAVVYRFLGRTVCMVCIVPVILYFYLTGGEQRRCSREFLNRVYAAGGLRERPGHIQALRHFYTFGASALDTLAAWTGNMPLSKIHGVEGGLFARTKRDGMGAFILTAHLGNPEVIRAIATIRERWRVNVLVHTANAERFNRLVEAFSGTSTVRLIQVTQIGPDTAIRLKDAIHRGEWVVMAGDRVPVHPTSRVSWAPFLGRPAPFSHGPFVLGSLLGCPVFLLFCIREGKDYRVYFEHFEDRIILPRETRKEALAALAAKFASRLECYVHHAPFQWFNFFDYWAPDGVALSGREEIVA